MNAFMDPKFYDHEVKDVKLLQTHISYVFLTGGYAYKMKKPVNFGFLDFTTLEKRKEFCEKELKINKRLSPAIYLAVIPVTDLNGKIELNGKGKIVEYVLKMKEIPQDRIMNKLLEGNKVTTEHIERIAKIISDFHNKAETSEKISEYGSVKTIKLNWDENFQQTAEFIGRTINKEKFYFIKNRIDEFLKNKYSIFEKRIKNGKIKDCHGDFHSGNVFIADDIYVFDAIEFNERFRYADVTYDIAFFTMDLDFKGRNDLSCLFIDKYVYYSNDDLSDLLVFYKCYTAYVRGKVLSFKLNDESVDENDKAKSAELAKKYFDLAYEYATCI